MGRLDSAFLELGQLDRLSYQDTGVHRLDPRAKLVTTLAFVACVVSFDKYEVAALLPFAVFPLALAGSGNVPLGYLGRRLLTVAPFAFFVGAFNPLMDRTALLHLGPLAVSGGWVSFASILLRFGLTVGAALVLIATTSFQGVCLALGRLGVPRVLVVQFLFLYRYLFVLIDEGSRLVRARALRSFEGRGTGLRVFGHLIGHLLLRTVARAQRIHLAMRCRGFDGEVHSLRQLRFGGGEAAFVAGWCLLFAALRVWNLPHFVGRLVTEFAR